MAPFWTIVWIVYNSPRSFLCVTSTIFRSLSRSLVMPSGVRIAIKTKGGGKCIAVLCLISAFLCPSFEGEDTKLCLLLSIHYNSSRVVASRHECALLTAARRTCSLPEISFFTRGSPRRIQLLRRSGTRTRIHSICTLPSSQHRRCDLSGGAAKSATAASRWRQRSAFFAGSDVHVAKLLQRRCRNTVLHQLHVKAGGHRGGALLVPLAKRKWSYCRGSGTNLSATKGPPFSTSDDRACPDPVPRAIVSEARRFHVGQHRTSASGRRRRSAKERSP